MHIIVLKKITKYTQIVQAIRIVKAWNESNSVANKIKRDEKKYTNYIEIDFNFNFIVEIWRNFFILSSMSKNQFKCIKIFRRRK